MSKIITISGKGGVGKTTTATLLIDGLAMAGYSGRLLVVDGDPAMTLYLALDQVPPARTIADVRDNTRLDAHTIRNLPAGVTPAAHVARQLQQAQALGRGRLREMNFHMLAMGWGEGKPGCYCSINNLLSALLEQIISHYDLIIIDNEAGLEHLSRYRVKRADLFITVTGPNLASRLVAGRIAQAAACAGMEIGQAVTVCMAGRQMNADFQVPYDPELDFMAAHRGSLTGLAETSPARRALSGLVQRALQTPETA